MCINQVYIKYKKMRNFWIPYIYLKERSSL
jgi:hypothetical protein